MPKYPGSRPSTNVIERAGGPDRWRPPEADLRDPELRVWQWLQRPPVLPNQLSKR
jgi:hypothetical protein